MARTRSASWQIRAKAELERRRRVTGQGDIRLWHPLPGPQSSAFESEAFETLYGGAAGGGKSDLLLGVARYNHYRVLLLRRTFPDLERSLIIRSQDFYGDLRRYNASKHRWVIEERRIEFGHLEHNKSVFQYQSAQYDLIGFDELTQFTAYQYEYMFSRARTVAKGRRVRIVACSNPGGEGNDWVMERWRAWLDETYPNPARSGEIRWFKRDAKGRDVECSADDPDAVSRTFIAAKLKDNPYLGSEYRKTLNLLPEPLRSQLLNGDWQSGMTDDAYQVIPRAWIKAAQARWKSDGRPLVQTAAGAWVLTPLTTLGVDVARGGDDKTVLAKRYENWFAELEKYDGMMTPDGPTVAALIVQALTEGGKANIDVIGVGSSAYDHARQAKARVAPVNFAEKSDRLDKSGLLRFANKRAEGWWLLREALDPTSGVELALPPDPELMGDLVAPRWVMRTNGILIESKEEIKRRLGRSPDCGDAVVLCNMPTMTVTDAIGWG